MMNALKEISLYVIFSLTFGTANKTFVFFTATLSIAFAIFSHSIFWEHLNS